jgi:hypothetical protein
MRPELEGHQDFGAMTGSLGASGRFAAGARQIASKLRSYAFGRSRIYTPTASAEAKLSVHAFGSSGVVVSTGIGKSEK